MRSIPRNYDQKPPACSRGESSLWPRPVSRVDGNGFHMLVEHFVFVRNLLQRALVRLRQEKEAEQQAQGGDDGGETHGS